MAWAYPWWPAVGAKNNTTATGGGTRRVSLLPAMRVAQGAYNLPVALDGHLLARAVPGNAGCERANDFKGTRAISAALSSDTQSTATAGAEEDFFADSYARVRAAPEDVANWHDLSAALQEQGARANRRAVLEAVRAMQATHPLAAYLRASFLYKQTGEPQELERAGRALIQDGYA
ncbi:MAG: hypothetical protein ABIH03_04800, partial [Pseudomonadota bacterium]